VTELERTEDGHHVVIDGRRWRATDQLLPEEVGAQLRRQAKTALGERGTPCLEQTEQERRDRWEAGLDRSLDA